MSSLWCMQFSLEIVIYLVFLFIGVFFFLLRLSFIYLFFFRKEAFLILLLCRVNHSSFLSFFSVSVGIVYVSCAKASEPRIVSSPFFLYIHLCLVFIPISLLFSHSLSLSLSSFFLFPPFFFLILFSLLIALSARAKSSSHGITLPSLFFPSFGFIYVHFFILGTNPLLEVVPSSSSRLGLCIAQNEVAWDKKRNGKMWHARTNFKTPPNFQTATLLLHTKNAR